LHSSQRKTYDRIVYIMRNKLKKSMVFGAVTLLIFGLSLSGCLNGYDELELKEFKFVMDHESLEEREPLYEDAHEDVLIYLEVEGFEAKDEIIEWSVYVIARNPEGEVYDDLNRIEITNTSQDIGGDWGIIESGPELTPPYDGWEEGENELEIEVIDHVGEKNLIVEETFEVDL